jgi:hypothetical protein
MKTNMNQCCNNLEFEFVADANKADGCEFTIGKCKNCQTNLIHCFQTSIVHPGVYQVVDNALISKALQLEGKEQKEFMRAWYRSL